MMTLQQMMWLAFSALVAISLFIDLGLRNNNKHIHVISTKEAALWSAIWIALGVGFGAFVGVVMGWPKAMEYWAGYLLEKSLSVDNMFVFIMIFDFFQITPLYQPRILKYGILGAIMMRALIIFLGVALLQRFHWIMYVFGVMLIVTAIRMWKQEEDHASLDQNPVVKWIRRWFPVTNELHGHSFVVVKEGRRMITPLFLALIIIELSDLVFAVDSIPAVLAISHDPFIVLTSNIFAILGLRALYFLLAGIMGRFEYLKTGLVIVLLFIGLKMVLVDVYHVSIAVSLSFIATVLGSSILFSLWKTRTPTPAQ